MNTRNASPEAVETALQFLRVAASANLKHEETFGKHGLTLGRFSLLMLLRHEPNRSLSPSELAKRTQVTRGTMTQFIDALEKDHLVKRTDDPNDRRAMLVQLTSTGEDLLRKVLPDHLKKLAKFTKVLNRNERKQLLSLMEKLQDGLAEGDPES